MLFEEQRGTGLDYPTGKIDTSCLYEGRAGSRGPWEPKVTRRLSGTEFLALARFTIFCSLLH